MVRIGTAGVYRNFSELQVIARIHDHENPMLSGIARLDAGNFREGLRFPVQIVYKPPACNERNCARQAG